MKRVECEGVGDNDGFFEIATEAVVSDQQRVVMRDLQREDMTYDNGFPANLCMGSCIVVQIPEQEQGVVLYTCKTTGRQARCYLPLEFRHRYTNDIYVFDA